MKKLSEATVFAQKLIIKKSVTPNDDGAIKVLKENYRKWVLVILTCHLGLKKIMT